MRYKVKLERDGEDAAFGEWKATLYEDPPSSKLRYVAVAFGNSRDEVLRRIRGKRDVWEARREPEWVSLDDVPEPQSLKAV